MGDDIRGSGSEDVRNEALRKLGPIHKGRKKVQPSREELRAFHKKVGPCLAFDPVWYDEAKRHAIGEAFGQVVKKIGYTVGACALLRNHAHIVVRRHRDDAVAIWRNFGLAGQAAVREFSDVDKIHPIWSGRPYKVFMYTPTEVSDRVDYVEKNPEKEGLARQSWPFVLRYDNWPLHGR